MKLNIKFNYVMLLVAFVLIVLFAHYYLTHGISSLLPKASASTQYRLGKLPDFSKINDVTEKKESFFATLYPIIEYENQHVLKIRELVIDMQNTPFDQLTGSQLDWLLYIANYYDVEGESVTDALFDMLLMRVDYIPPSLVLTQAAIESGWGSSRFSKQGNNLFGQWCYVKGCGMVPLTRDINKGHEVARFKTVNASVRSYIKNLNTHYAYAELRQKRAAIRSEKQSFSGVSLASTLDKYSEERHHYVAKVTRFIKHNKLQRFTHTFEQSLLVVKD